MKKIYFLGVSLLIAGVSFGQSVTPTYKFGKQKKGENVATNYIPGRFDAPVQHGDRALNIIWTEDFTSTGGLTTGQGTWVAGGTDASFWSIGTTHPLSGFGWSAALNGDYLTFDSYNNVPSETNGFATTPVSANIESPTIDLSGATSAQVYMKMDVESMWCCGIDMPPYYMYVSTDNGGTWSSAIPIDLGVDRNVATDDVTKPLPVQVNISSYLDATAANNNQVKVRFEWNATSSDANGQYSTHYFWLIDNLEFYEVPAYDMAQNKLYLADIVNGIEYTRIPDEQATNTLTVQSTVTNLGANPPSNIGLEVEVFDDMGATVHGPETGGTATVGTFATDSKDTITFNTTLDLSTLAIGTYTVRSVISYTETDENMVNDTLYRDFEITDNTLSHVSLDQSGFSRYWGDPTGTPYTYELGSIFTVENADELEGVDFYISSGNSSTNPPSTDGALVEFFVYQAGSTTWDQVAGPFTYTIDASMFDQWNTFNFYLSDEGYTPYTLDPSQSYVVAMRVYQSTVVRYVYNPLDDDFTGRLYDHSVSTWYWSGDEPWIELNFNEALSVEEANNYNFSIGQNVPNPFDNNSTISYTLEENANVSVDFIDVTGKIVTSFNQGNQDAGTYQLKIDGNDFAEGVYFYTFTVGDKKVTKRMVVTK